MVSTLPILPVAFLLSASLLTWLVGRDEWRLAAIVTLAEGAVLLVVALLFVQVSSGTVLVHPLGGWYAPQGIAFVADRLSVFLLVVVSLVSAAALAYALLDEESADRSKITLLLLLLQTGVSGALSSGDLFNFYVFFELMGIASYASVAYRRSEAHLEAAWKYAVLSLCGSSFLLIGVGAVYAQTGILTFASMYEASFHVHSPPLYLFSVGLILVALALKAAIVPLHFWLPDAHSIAPTAVSVLLSGTVVNVGVYGILRFLSSQAPWVWEEAGGVLLAAGSATAIGCTLVAAIQRDLKRLLAYSTSSQMGYAVSVAALGTEAGVTATLVTLAAHAWTKSTLFVCAGIAMDASGQRQWRRMGGFGRSPLFSATFFVGCLSLAGIPPLAGFASKLHLFSSLLSAGQITSLLCILGASLVMIGTMARVWLALQSRRPLRSLSSGHLTVGVGLGAIVVISGFGLSVWTGEARRAASDLLDGDVYRQAVLTARQTGETR